MLDLTLPTRIAVDEVYDELLNSHGFQQYRGVLTKWDHPPYFDGVIMRLYNEEGELVEERSPTGVASLAPDGSPKIPFVVRPSGRGLQWSGSHWYDKNNSFYTQDDIRDASSDYVLIDQFRPVFIDADEDRALHIPLYSGRKEYVIMCLVYEPAERWDRDARNRQRVAFRYAFDAGFSNKYVGVNSNDFTFAKFTTTA